MSPRGNVAVVLAALCAAAPACAQAPRFERSTTQPNRLPSPALEQPVGVAPAEAVPAGLPTPTPIDLADVVRSVRLHFPLIDSAVASRTIASGEALAAAGAFDHKLEAYSNNQPLDFYENYRHQVGVKRDTFWGGQVFAGYRNGRGEFEPWYLERETNKGGEFKAGFVAPLAKDRWIDENRAEFWRAQLETSRVEPEILAQVILYVRDGSFAYWDWVAAGQNFRVAEGLLDLAARRNEFIAREVQAGEKAAIDVVDNRRSIASREAKAIDARRKLEQSAVKLSLFLRGPDGAPVVPPRDLLPPQFPPVAALDPLAAERDVALALATRPELAELSLVRRQLDVAYRQASNETIPDIDGGLMVGQDVGEPASAKRDKSEMELEATLMLSVPLERRKAYGKLRQLRGKFAQVRAKTRFAADKIAAEVQVSRAALVAAAERVEWTAEAVDLAAQMQVAEQTLYEAGDSNLLNLNLREVQYAEAAIERVIALLEFYLARAEYLAALGVDDPTVVPIDTLDVQPLRRAVPAGEADEPDAAR
ncbi:MAG: TolC family protein [Lacipirellulaceae bacterium]